MVVYGNSFKAIVVMHLLIKLYIISLVPKVTNYCIKYFTLIQIMAIFSSLVMGLAVLCTICSCHSAFKT